MKPVRSLILVLVGCFMLIHPVYGEGEAPLLYPTGADARADIARALEKAKQENKHVLIQWGANWCMWCHRLHEFFQDDTESKSLISKSYVVVLVDTDTSKALLDEMDVSPRGIPYLTVLDADGKKLIDQDTEQLESGSDGYDTEKVTGFLRQWRPKLPESSSDGRNADERIAAALEIAKREGRSVIVTVGTSWCAWCERLQDFLTGDKAGPVLERYFVIVPLNQEKVEGANAFRWANALDKSSGIPWYAVLDATGKVLATSDRPKEGNTGYPARPDEIAWFMDVLKRAAPGMDEASIGVVETELTRLGKALIEQ